MMTGSESRWWVENLFLLIVVTRLFLGNAYVLYWVMYWVMSSGMRGQCGQFGL